MKSNFLRHAGGLGASMALCAALAILVWKTLEHRQPPTLAEKALPAAEAPSEIDLPALIAGSSSTDVGSPGARFGGDPNYPLHNIFATINGEMTLNLDGQGCLVVDARGRRFYIAVGGQEYLAPQGSRHLNGDFRWLTKIATGDCWELFRQHMDSERIGMENAK